MKKLVLLTAIVSIGVAQNVDTEKVMEVLKKNERNERVDMDNMNTEKVLELLRKKEQEQQQKNAEARKEEEERRKKALQRCKDFPAEKLGRPENYLVFQPAFLGIALQEVKAKVRRLEGPVVEKRYTEVTAGGKPYTEVHYLAYHVEVPMTLKEFVDNSFIASRMKKVEEFDSSDKLIWATRYFTVRQVATLGWLIYRSDMPPAFLSGEGFKGFLREKTSDVLNLREVLEVQPSRFLMSGQMYGMSIPLIAPLMLHGYYPDIDKDYCIYWEPLGSGESIKDILRKALPTLITGGVYIHTQERGKIMRDMKVHKGAMLKVATDGLGNYKLTIVALRNEKGKTLPKGEDRGVSLGIEQGTLNMGRAFCFNKEDVRQLQAELKQNGKYNTLKMRGVPAPDYMFTCGYIPLHIIERTVISRGSDVGAINDLKKDWYPFLACIEFQDHVCTIAGDPVVTAFKYERGPVRVPTPDDLLKAAEYLQKKREYLETKLKLGNVPIDPPKPPTLSLGIMRPGIHVEEKGINQPLPADMEVLIGSLEALAREEKK